MDDIVIPWITFKGPGLTASGLLGKGTYPIWTKIRKFPLGWNLIGPLLLVLERHLVNNSGNFFKPLVSIRRTPIRPIGTTWTLVTQSHFRASWVNSVTSWFTNRVKFSGQVNFNLFPKLSMEPIRKVKPGQIPCLDQRVEQHLNVKKG